MSTSVSKGMSTALPLKQSKSKTEWVKFGRVRHLYFIAKNVICVYGGCHLYFLNLVTGQKNILRVNEASVGEGVGCFAGHRSLPVFGFAEKCKNPKIRVMNYPEFKTVSIMSEKEGDYMRLVFSESELLLSLSGFPTCMLAVWKWRTGEFITNVATNLIYSNVVLRCNFSTPVQVSQLILNTRRLIVWQIAMCGRKCIISQEDVTYREPDNLNNFTMGTWTTEGTLLVMDAKGNLYQLAPDYILDRIITWDEEDGKFDPSFTLYKGGALIYGPNGVLKYFTKSGDWNQMWRIKTDYTVKKITGRNYCILVSTSEDIYKFNDETSRVDLLYGTVGNITDFAIISPLGERVVTLANEYRVAMWDISTGELVDIMIFEGEQILKMNANREYGYVAVVSATGLLRLISTMDDKLAIMASFQLWRNPLNCIKFFEDGKVLGVGNLCDGVIFIIEGIPGTRFKILNWINAGTHLADFIIVGAKTCLRIYTIVVTSDVFVAGNNITRFCITNNCETSVKTYELENPNRLYSRIFVSLDKKRRDRVFYAIPLDNKNLHELETKRADTHARIIGRMKTGHLMKRIRFVFSEEFVISYAADGIVLIRTRDMSEILHVVMPHHRGDGGVRRADMDHIGKYLISIGRENMLVCTSLTDAEIDTEYQQRIQEQMEKFKLMYKTPTIGFQPHGIYENKSWLEYKDLLEIERDRARFENERNSILAEFAEIKEEAVELLTNNLEGPENERLDLQEFNLDLVAKEEKIRVSKETCDRTKLYLERLIAEQDRVSKLIKERFWDKISVQSRNIWAIFGNFDVQSYAIPPVDGERNQYLEKIQGNRQVEEMLAHDDIFKPWTYMNDAELKQKVATDPKMLTKLEPSIILNLEMEDEEDSQVVSERLKAEQETYTAFAGTTLHHFIELEKGHYSQAELQSFQQHQWDLYMSMNEQNKLMEFFNKEFENMMQMKIREMGNIIEKNAKLRYILSELNYFSKDKFDIVIMEPEWRQDENPELLTKVENNEVSILPYISPSEQAILDAKAAEAERLRLLMLADDFKERALMKMMNGVLEIRWEDELRKEVPKPKCMLEKDPEEYGEEDLRAIKEYEEKVVTLENEREKYRGILQAEYAKQSSHLREGVRKFNERLQELLLLKIQAESANMHEVLRANRLRLWEINLNTMIKEEKKKMLEIEQSEGKTEELDALVTNLKEFRSEIRQNLEILQNKEKFLDKAFRREFVDVSPALMDILSKLYKKRPKSNIRAITSTCVLLETAHCIVTNTKSILLLPESLDLMHYLDSMDKYIGIPPVIDERHYAGLCRHRRIKIESELKIRAITLELTEADNTIEMYEKLLAKAKTCNQTLSAELEDHREKKLHHSLNMELQIVLKEGFVEIRRTGRMEDFEDAILISRADVENINDIIIETGKKKLKAMKNAMTFKREIILMEWEHKKKKMEIEDLKNYIEEIKSVKLTKEIQGFLKARARGENADKLLSFDHEVEISKQKYLAIIQEHKDKIKDIDAMLENLKYENMRADKQIQSVNVDVCEYKLNFDKSLHEKGKKYADLKMAAFLKRSRLVQKIQENHNEILVLQAQLEILRLKTFPVLDYKVEV